MDTMLAIGYARVSTDRQADQGVSLDAQTAKIRAMATVQGAELLDVVVDGGESAKSMNRPGLQRVLDLVRDGKVEAVIVAKLDRLTRSVKDLCELLELFERRRVALVSVAESLDTSTAAGRPVRTNYCNLFSRSNHTGTRHLRVPVARRHYCCAAPSPPSLQDRHIPNPLPFATMKVHRFVRRLNSPALNVAPEKGVSGLEVPATGVACVVVPHAAKPGARPARVTTAAELVQLPFIGTLASNLTTPDVG
jgi:hypothetical protein